MDDRFLASRSGSALGAFQELQTASEGVKAPASPDSCRYCTNGSMTHVFSDRWLKITWCASCGALRVVKEGRSTYEDTVEQPSYRLPFREPR